MAEVLLQVENLHVDLGRGPVLQNVFLQVRSGDFLGLVGPNGSGKTTLLKAVLGLVRPQQGEVRLFGQEPGRFLQWGRIGYLSQQVSNFNRDFPATVEEIVRAHPGPGILRGRINKGMVDEALEEVGLREHRRHLLGRLSGGQQQKAFLARLLVGNPEMLILDEPTNGLDPEGKDSFFDLLSRLNRSRGVTVLLVTHDLAAVARLAQRVVYLEHGHLHEQIPWRLQALAEAATYPCLTCSSRQRLQAAGDEESGRSGTEARGPGERGP